MKANCSVDGALYQPSHLSLTNHVLRRLIASNAAVPLATFEGVQPKRAVWRGLLVVEIF